MSWLRSVSVCVLALCMEHSAADGAEAHVKITAPADGARVDGMEQTKLVYETNPGPRGDHVHVYIDGKEVGILRQLKGSYTLEALSPGQRTICIKVVNRSHVPIGVEQCIRVTVE